MSKKQHIALAAVGAVIAVGIIAASTSVPNQPSIGEQSGDRWISIMEANLKLCQLADSLEDLQDLRESMELELPALREKMPGFTGAQISQLDAIAWEIDACMNQKIEEYVP